MSVATLTINVDLPNTPLTTDDTEVSTDVIAEGRQAGGLLLTIERGHDQSRVLSPPLAGYARFLLDNVAGTYNLSSNLKAGRGVRMRAAFSGTTYDMFGGVLDHPMQSPVGQFLKHVDVQCFGQLAKLAGRTVDTALYSTILTSDAIIALLDAASFPKNLTDYLTDLGPIVGWDLASTSGDDPDVATGHDAVITLGAGVRGDTAIDDGGTLSLQFDGAATKATVAAHADFQDWQALDSLVFMLFKADTSGEGNVGRLYDKGAINYLCVADPSGSTMRLRYVQDYNGGGSVDGQWDTTSRVITAGVRYAVAVHYNGSSTANNPTMWLFDLDALTYSKLTVGSGLTRTTAPSGSRTSDAGQALILGNNSGASATFDGNIGVVRVYGPLGNAAYFEPYVQQAFNRAAFAPRHIDEGNTILDWWWLDNENALTALETLKNTEGPGAALYEDGTGAIVFKHRHARSMDSRSTSVQTTFRSSDGAMEPLLSLPFNYSPGLKDVVNICSVETVRREAAASAEVWALGETVDVGAGETRMIVARANDPFQNAITPSSGGGDYTVTVGSLDTVSLNRTSGATVTISLYSAAGCTVTGLRLRAEAVEVVNTSVVSNSVDTSASQDEFGASTYRLNTRREITANLGQDFCNAVVGYYQNGRPTIDITVDAMVADARMTAALAREVGDRIHVIVGTDVDEDMFVEHIRHEVFAPRQHRTTFGLETATAAVSYFVLDTSELDSTDVLAF